MFVLFAEGKGIDDMPVLLLLVPAGCIQLREISVETFQGGTKSLNLMSTVTTSALSSRAIVKKKTSLTSLARDLWRLAGDCSSL